MPFTAPSCRSIARRTPWRVAAVALLACLGACDAVETATPTQTPETPPTQTREAPLEGIASVIDGDTIEIHGQRIRLFGIDAPESGQRCSDANIYQQAAEALRAQIGARTVRCTPEGPPDRYGRHVARCTVGNVELNAFMVEQGWARDWPRYSDGAYAPQEARARAAQRGAWRAACSPDIWSGRDYTP